MNVDFLQIFAYKIVLYENLHHTKNSPLYTVSDQKAHRIMNVEKHGLKFTKECHLLVK